jgi:aminoglycoside phosphotransferase (APT) family kinase protein
MGDEWIDRAAPVRPGEELDLGRLAAYLQERLPELKGDLAIEQYPRGYSNLTYLLRYGDRRLVLRRPPFGAAIKSAHDMSREYRILGRLGRVYPRVPQALLYCDDETVLGAPFYVMTHLAGVILRPQMPAAMRPDASLMRRIAASFVDNLAELHQVDYAAAGLGDLGHPEGYVRRQIEGWTGRYRDARTDDVPEMEQAAAWLRTEMPAESGAALIHNDYKYDNLVLDPVDWARIVGVLDWEMATIGDPLLDLGTSLGYWIQPDDPDELQALQLSPTALPGNPTRAELISLYEERSGRRATHPTFYYVYGLFKVAVIVQQIYARYRRGDSQDPRFAGLIEAVRACGRTAVRAIQAWRRGRRKG